MSERFETGEAGEGRHAYTCSYHVFRLGDGRIVVVDLVRSDDTGRLGLRVFVATDEGEVRAMLREAPAAEWAPFVSGGRPALDGRRDVLGRGDGWIAGRVDGAGPDLRHVAFDLAVEPLEAGRGTGELSLAIVEMSVTDFPRVRTRGWIELDEERFAVDAVGTASIHFGRRLCEYTYLVTAPRGGAEASPSLLLASARGDDLRFGGALLGDRVVTYAYGDGGLPSRFVNFARFSTTPLDLGEGGALELADLRVVPHRLLDLPTITGTALATYVGRPAGALPGVEDVRVPLGRVVVDARGEAYVSHFPAGPGR